MSTRALFQVLKWKLPPTQKLVAIFAGDQANDAGECWFTLAHACSFTSLTDRTVRKAIAALEAAGKVKRLFRPGRANQLLLMLEQTPAFNAGVGAERRSGGAELRSGGAERGAGVYIEKNLTSPTYLPSKRRDINRACGQEGNLATLSNSMLVKICKAQGVATIGRTRDELLTLLRQRRS